MTASQHDYRGFVFAIRYMAADPAYLVDFPDFPQIITSGTSLAQAFENACEALDVHLESMRKLGKKEPKPRHQLVLKSA